MDKILKSLEKKEVYLSILILIVFFFSMYQYGIVKDYKQVPACLYGCDLYNHMGKVYHLYDGGSYFLDGANPNVNPWVPSLHHQMITWFGKITGLEPMQAFNHFTIIAGIFCIIISFFLFKTLFNNVVFGFLGMLLFLPFFPIWKYTAFSVVVFMPLFYLVFFIFFKNRNIKNAILVGLVFGVISNLSSNAFISMSLYVAFAFFYLFIPKLLIYFKSNVKLKERKKFLIDILNTCIVPFAIISIIGISISMIYWYEPIFKYHMHTPNMQMEYDLPDLNVSSNFFNAIKTTFVNFISFGTLYNSFFVILFILSLIFSFSLKFKNENNLVIKNFLLMSFFAAFFGSYSFVLTFPILKINLSSGHIQYILFTSLRVILVMFSLFMIYNLFSSKIKKKEVILALIVLLVIFVSFFGIKQSLNAHQNDPFAKNANYELDPARSDVQNWVRENTDVNDIFLTTNEEGFALNGFTGRKMMTMRRSHSSQFLDFNQIMLDAGLILYGNNSELTKELLEKYDVKYFYWDQYWMQSEFQFNDKGELAGFFDPLVTVDTPERRILLDENGIRFIARTWYIDPGEQRPGHKMYDLLYILPPEFNSTHPWGSTFDDFLNLEHEVSYGGSVFARIFSINVNNN